MGKLLESEGFSVHKRSSGVCVEAKDVVLLDTLGELSKAYQLADVSFVGATLVDIGGHNPLEPAYFSSPVIVGPYHSTVKDAVSVLESKGGGIVAKNVSELTSSLRKLLSDDTERLKASKVAKVVSNYFQGATEIVYQEITSLLDEPIKLKDREPGFTFTVLSKLFQVGVEVRNYLFDVGLRKQAKSKLPVISIGNITVGGSGKTPVSALMVETLIELGKKPVLLSRGYGGSSKGPTLVKVETTAKLVGDEALMQARGFNFEIPVVISRKRSLGAKFIEENNLGDIIVLDDGFQHRMLSRDLDIVVLDISEKNFETRFKLGRMLPAGRFREKPRPSF